MSFSSTLPKPAENTPPKDLAQKLWDFIIIGAGPAGSMAAYELSKFNRSILMVDQAEFPRLKVCGGCLSRRALQILKHAGLGDLSGRLGAKKLREVRLFSEGKSVSLTIPEGAGLSRERLDSALAAEAIKRGAVFLDKTKGRFDRVEEGSAYVHLTRPEGGIEVRAQMVLLCGGLSGTASGLKVSERALPAKDSLIGISAVLPSSALSVEEGVITMLCADEGYAGITKREDDQLDIAAAIQPSFLKRSGTPGRCLEQVFSQNGFAVPEGLHTAAWHGTQPLTHSQKKVSAPRCFILGDASGYVEPFTGEGMTWALLQARDFAALLESRGFEWDESLIKTWQKRHQQKMGLRMRACRVITLLLRFAWARTAALNTLRAAPWLAAPLIRFIHGDSE